MPAVALTDHGNLYGAIEFYQHAKKAGITPIIGVELYLTAGRLHQKRPHVDDVFYHLLLLAENNIGYKNLIYLTTIANVDGFYYHPRIDKQILANHAEGIMCLSGCLKGELAQALIKGENSRAHEIIDEYQDIFGKDRYFIEIQRHAPTDPSKAAEERAINEQLIRLSQDRSIPIVATNDSHYLTPDEAEAQDALICIQSGKNLNDGDRLSLKGYDLSFPGPDAMLQRFSDIAEACATTVAIAARCHVDLSTRPLAFPIFPLPENVTADTALASKAHQQLAKRIIVTDRERERLDYELGIIKTKGFSAYFLVVADFVDWAKKNHIVTTTRGSAAGSLVSYALGITTLNPIDYKLPFERFLNPERPQAPDIDVDLADEQRDAVITYVVKKYGRRKVAKIVTFGTLLARAAVRDVVRVLGLSYSFGDRIAKMIPLGAQGFPMTIKRALEQSEELRSAAQNDREIKRVLDLAEKIEGSARHASVHAAGVVIAPSDLTDFVPLQREARGGGDTLITQYDMASCEHVGLVKIDFLGIRNLSILEKAIKIIRHRKQVEINLDTLPLDDVATYTLLAHGETIGLFQLGGSGMTRYLKELKPTSIFDIMAMVALYRPGPMESIPEYIKRKHGTSKVSYLDPRLKDILDQSYGILVYQDDVLMIAITLAGYSWLEADKLRKAMGKKIPREMAAQKEKFISGCITKGKLPEKKAQQLWGLIEPFAAYGFNKAHAASYARVAYQTAYLKAHYPAEFMTAVLTCESGNMETIAEAVRECAKLGIKVLPPDVNSSRADFTCISDTEIRFGLTAIKNLGSDIAHGIIFERKAHGPFDGLPDFLKRLGIANLNKKSLESLIKSGALDRFDDRRRMLAHIDHMLDFIKLNKQTQNSRQQSLFGSLTSARPTLTLGHMPINIAPEDPLSWEKELLGLYVTGHPLEAWTPRLPDQVSPIGNLEKKSDTLYVAGVVTRIEKKVTRKGETMAFAAFEDTTGMVELLVFPKTLAANPSLWNAEAILYIDGKLTDKDGVPKIIVNEAYPLTEQLIAALSRHQNRNALPHDQKPPTSIILITLTQPSDPAMNKKLKTSLAAYPGPLPVRLVVKKEGRELQRIDTHFSIAYNDSVKQELEAICGPGTVTRYDQP